MTLPTNNQTEPQHPLDEQSVFIAARTILNTTEREAFVRQACGDDLDRVSQIMALLQVDADDPEFLKTPVATSEITALYFREGPQQGDAVGPYSLIEPLGTGGMGIVWMAEQSVPIRRRVALKIMNAGFGTESDLQQFDSERQLLATLDHSGIVKLLDAGNTSDGRPWFAMEFVTGQKITEYCNQKQLSLPERISLFLGVCESVEHAHQRCVVHRDMKPANILIAETQGRPVSKLIDFGVSFPLTSLDDDERSSPARQQVVQGTPTYMSPEQAAFNSEPADHRTDIYSLGALLYEIVAGVPPYSSPTWDGSDAVERLRIIRETSPPLLSERLRSLPYGDYIPKERSSVTRRMLTFLQNRAILQDLNQITSAACARDPGNRYQSVQRLADDLRRCLDHRPLLTAGEFRDPQAKSSERNDAVLSNGVHLTDDDTRITDSVFKFGLRHSRTLVLTSGLVFCFVGAAVLGAWLFSSVLNDGTRITSKHAAFTADGATPTGNASTTDGRVYSAADIRESVDAEEQKYVDFIREAHFLIQQGQIQEARSVLQHVAESKRFSISEQTHSLPFEVQYLLALCEANSKSFQVHTGKVFDVRFSPDGTRIVSCGGVAAQYRTKVQDTETGAILTSFFNGANACCFRKSDGALFTADDRGWVSEWDLSQAEPPELSRLEGFENPVGRVWVAPGERILLATEIEWQSVRCRTTVWDSATKTLLKTLDAQRTIGIHETSGQFVTISQLGQLNIWTMPEIESVRSIETQLVETTSGDVSKSGLVAVGNRAGRIWLWKRTGEGDYLDAEGIPVTSVRDLAFTPDSQYLSAAYNDGTLRLWDVRSGELLKVIQTGVFEAWSLDISPNGQLLAAGLGDGTIQIYRFDELEIGFRRGATFSHSLHGSDFFSDGTHAVIPGAEPNRALVVRVPDGQLLQKITAVFESPAEHVSHCLQPNATNDIILTSSTGRVYVARSGSSEASLCIDTESGRAIIHPTVSADGRWIAVPNDFKSARHVKQSDENLSACTLYDLKTGKAAFWLPSLAPHAEKLPFIVASVSDRNPCRVLSQQGKSAVVWSFDPDSAPSAVMPANVFTLPRWLDVWDLNDDGLVLIAAEDQGVYVWDSRTSRSRPRLLRQRMEVTCIAVSPDQQTLATGNLKGEIMLWALPSAEPLFSLPGSFGSIFKLSFSESGQQLDAIADTPERTGEIQCWTGENNLRVRHE